MLSETEGFVRLPGERIVYTSPPRTSLSLRTSNPYPGRQPFSASSSAGCVHLTNQRLVYLAASPTPELNSFSCPILNIHDSHISAPFFGPNLWEAIIQPVTGGGLPNGPVQVKFTFRDGGAFDFSQFFERIKERLQQAVDVARENGELSGSSNILGSTSLANVHLEELPAYEEAGSASARPPPIDAPHPTSVSTSGPIDLLSTPNPEPAPRNVVLPPILPPRIGSSQSTTFQPPADPPPGYEEVQRASVADHLEESLRQHAEREAEDAAQ
jgi:hypothetical protein